MKLFLISAISFCSITSFSQVVESNEDYKNLISLSPTEVYSSAIITLNFEEAKQVNYTLLEGVDVVLTKTINKIEGESIIKTDFSGLNNGAYSIIFYIDDKEVRRIDFSKK